MIYKTVRVRGARRRKPLTALFDSGASTSAIRASLARTLGKPIKLQFPRTAETAVGRVTIREAMEAVIQLNGHPIEWFFFLVPDLTEELVIGEDFLDRFNVRLDFRRKRVVIDPRYLRLKLLAVCSLSPLQD